MLKSKWQWMDNTYGPMGWFTNAEKIRHEGTAEFKNGHWRPISEEELRSFNAYIGNLAYEQS